VRFEYADGVLQAFWQGVFVFASTAYPALMVFELRFSHTQKALSNSRQSVGVFARTRPAVVACVARGKQRNNVADKMSGECA
jgi:hypothetical protein